MTQSKLEQVKEALALWRETEKKYFDYGVGDTEPNQAFQVIVKRIVKGEQIDWDFFDNNGWSIFSCEKGYKAVCRALSSRARRIGKKIKSIIDKASHADKELCIEYIKDAFWRCDWDYVHDNGRM